MRSSGVLGINATQGAFPTLPKPGSGTERILFKKYYRYQDYDVKKQFITEMILKIRNSADYLITCSIRPLIGVFFSFSSI